MRDHIKQIFSFLTIVVFTACLSCDDNDDEPAKKSKQEDVSEILRSGTWHLGSVSVGGVETTDYLENLSISFSASSFSATNGEPVFPPQDSWSFADEEAQSIITGDGLEIGVSSATKEMLQLTFVWDTSTLGEGRENSIAGEHIVTLVK